MTIEAAFLVIAAIANIAVLLLPPLRRRLVALLEENC